VKHVSSILLFSALAALLYINVGDLARISVGLIGAKLEASEKLKVAGNLQQLTISLKEISSGDAFVMGKNEMRYHGKLYDIASRAQDDQNLYLQVISDETEEGLLSDLKEHVDQWFNLPQKNTGKKNTIKRSDLLKDFIPSENLALLVTMPSVNLYSTSTNAQESPFIPVIKSPPRLG